MQIVLKDTILYQKNYIQIKKLNKQKGRAFKQMENLVSCLMLGTQHSKIIQVVAVDQKHISPVF